MSIINQILQQIQQKNKEISFFIIYDLNSQSLIFLFFLSLSQFLSFLYQFSQAIISFNANIWYKIKLSGPHATRVETVGRLSWDTHVFKQVWPPTGSTRVACGPLNFNSLDFQKLRFPGEFKQDHAQDSSRITISFLPRSFPINEVFVPASFLLRSISVPIFVPFPVPFQK